MTNATNTPPAAPPQTPYDRLGGSGTIRVIVDRFYDLMDEDPDYAELRAMHTADLTPMRASLTGFLAAWSGGPRDWFADRPGACVMSLHGALGVTQETASQWTRAMRRAIDETVGDDRPLADAMGEALARMALGMARPQP